MALNLDFSSLKKAVKSLEEVLAEHKKQPSNVFIRDAAIQRFEYTYELSHKMLRRFLEMTEPNAEEIDQMSFSNMIRTASERNLLLHGWDQWKIYREARNATSHTYDEKKATQVFTAIPSFLKDAQHLLNQMIIRASQE